MADSAMVSAYFFAQKIEDFHPRFSWGVFKHPLLRVDKPIDTPGDFEKGS